MSYESSTFEQLLNMFWLRPETAMWREIDIKAMQLFKFESPSLDLGCGDGTFSFIRAGGKFNKSYDAFRTIINLEQFFDNADVFDVFDDTRGPDIKQSSAYQIDYGFDHKDSLLKKAGQLGLYKTLKLGDANKHLPFSDESFKSIFSNIVYWLDEPEAVLREIARILVPGGKVCLMLPNQSLSEYSFYNELYVKSGDSKWQFLEKLDRGRFADNIRHGRSSESWLALFQAVGLNVETHKRHLSKVAIQIWDIGLRPLFPVLLKLVNTLNRDDLLEIKDEWNHTLRQFLEPIIMMDDQFGLGTAPAFHCFILEK